MNKLLWVSIGLIAGVLSTMAYNVAGGTSTGLLERVERLERRVDRLESDNLESAWPELAKHSIDKFGGVVEY